MSICFPVFVFPAIQLSIKLFLSVVVTDLSMRILSDTRDGLCRF
ncbi:hypothetical protein [Tropheryma whipplei]|nr:hypothetical protein [Tropheryma whipplei]